MEKRNRRKRTKAGTRTPTRHEPRPGEYVADLLADISGRLQEQRDRLLSATRAKKFDPTTGDGLRVAELLTRTEHAIILLAGSVGLSPAVQKQEDLLAAIERAVRSVEAAVDTLV